MGCDRQEGRASKGKEKEGEGGIKQAYTLFQADLRIIAY